MTAFSNYINVTLTRGNTTLRGANFGTIMLLSHRADWVERTRTYTDIASVEADWPANSPERIAGTAIFSQNPAPTSFVIGRGANKPTQISQLSSINPTTNLNYTYSLLVSGSSFAPVTVTFTSDGTPTDAEYAAGMVAALNAVVGKNYTAAGASSPITITGTAPGDWFSVEVSNPSTQSVKMTHADPGVAADLTAIALENQDWYVFCTLYNSKLYGLAAAAWAETNEKVYLAESCDTETVNTVVGNADLLDTINTNQYAHTGGFYHPSPAAMLTVALAARCFAAPVGGMTLHAKPLVAMPTFVMTPTHRANIANRRATSYERVGNLINMSFGGFIASTLIGFVDVRRNLDSILDGMTRGGVEVLIGNDIVPLNDRGIGLFESKFRANFARHITLEAMDQVYKLTMPKPSEISAGDRALRKLSGVTAEITATGAIHSVNAKVTYLL